MPFRGIKNRVFIQLWILIFSSLFLTQVLVFFFSLEITISRTIEQKRATLIAFSLYQSQNLPLQKGKEGLENLFFADLPPDSAGVQDRFCFLWEALPGVPDSRDQSGELCTVVGEALRKGEQSLVRKGRVMWLAVPHPETVIITVVLKRNGAGVAASGVETSLVPIYHDFLELQKIALVFTVVVSLFFALLGTRQFRHIYFSPLQRLSRKAESYQDDDALSFAVRKEDDEFSVLSLSLNKMLYRISQDKAVLKNTILSLENANTELHKARNDIIRAEKLASVGRLASGIAHEIGNPVGIVLGYLELLKQNDITPDERNDFIFRSEQEITRINHIIRQLLDMSRSSAGEAGNVSIHLVLQDLMDVFACQPTAADISFEARFAAEHDQVYGEPDQIRQVLLNLLINAIDAIHTGDRDIQGRILLETRNPGLDETQSSMIEVLVKDNGPGIDPAIRSRLFDPFFTTKEPGKGTGLGLSVSFMIVEKLGGALSIMDTEDGEGSGSVLCMMLPLSSDPKGIDGPMTGDKP